MPVLQKGGCHAASCKSHDPDWPSHIGGGCSRIREPHGAEASALLVTGAGIARGRRGSAIQWKLAERLPSAFRWTQCPWCDFPMRGSLQISHPLRVSRRHLRPAAGLNVCYFHPHMTAKPQSQSAAQRPESTNLTEEWQTIGIQPETLPRFKVMPAPKTGNWKSYYGSWENFCTAMHQSIGRKIESGVLTFCEDWPPTAKKVTR